MARKAKKKRKEPESYVVIHVPKPKTTVWDVLGSIAATFFLVVFFLAAGMSVREAMRDDTGLPFSRSAAVHAAANVSKAPQAPVSNPDPPAPAPTPAAPAVKEEALPAQENATAEAPSPAEEQLVPADDTTPEETVPRQTAEPSADAEPPEVRVWLSATGSKYHSINNCSGMNPNSASQVPLSEAIARGYERCKNCW